METKKIPTIPFAGILTTLNLTPEAFLRRYGWLRFVNPNADVPNVVVMERGRADEKTELPTDRADVVSIGYVHIPEINAIALRLSALGDLPTKLATQILSAIDRRNLAIDETGHATYGFFPGSDLVEEYSHFIFVPGVTEQAVRLDNIDGAKITKFEFAGLNTGMLSLAAFAGTKAYETAIKFADVEVNTRLGWTPINVKPDVTDISMRYIDGRITTVVGTKTGLYFWRNNEIVTYKATEGMEINAIVAGYAGRLHTTEVPLGQVGKMMAFVARTDKGLQVFTSLPDPTVTELTPVTVDDESIWTVAETVVPRIIPGDDARWYVGYGNKMTATALPLS